MRRALSLAFALLGASLAAVTACGRDFDSLFFDSGLGEGDAGGAADGPVTTDANGATDGANGDGGAPCTGSCINQSGCDASSGTCTTVCSGCCDCGMQTCPASDGHKRCEAQCTSGATCNVDCLVNGPCSMTCAAGSQCLLRCGPSADSCDLSCADNSKKDCGGGRFVCGRSCP